MIRSETQVAVVDRMPALDEFEYSIAQSASAHIMESLRNMYTDPHYAVAREYICNALDAHAAGRCTDPIEVTTPSKFLPEFRVRSYGVGLDRSEAQVLFTFGESGHGKRETNDQRGYYGLGCKSGLAVSSVMTIHTYKDGTSCSWCCYLSETGLGKVKLVHTGGTTERDGLLVSIPVEAADFVRFGEAISKALRMVDDKVSLDGAVSRPASKFLASFDCAIQDRSYTAGRCFLVGGGHYVSARLVVCLGGMMYPVDMASIYTNKAVYYHDTCQIIVDVPTGALSLVPSRDTLMYDSRTVETLQRLFGEIRERFATTVQAAIDARPTPAAGFDTARRIYRGLRLGGDADMWDFAWRGKLHDIAKKIAIRDIRSQGFSRGGIVHPEFPLAFHVRKGRRGSKRLECLPRMVGRVVSSLSISDNSATLVDSGKSSSGADLLVLHPETCIVLVESSEGMTYTRIRNTLVRAADRYAGVCTVFIVAGKDELDELTWGDEPVKEVARGYIKLKPVRPASSRPATKQVKELNPDLEHGSEASGRPSRYWRDIGTKLVPGFVGWVPSSSGRVAARAIPLNWVTRVYDVRGGAPASTEVALCALRTLRRYDDRFCVITGGDVCPANAVPLSTLVERVSSYARDDVLRGPYDLLATYLAECNPLQAGWLWELAMHPKARGELMAQVRKRGALHKFLSAVDRTGADSFRYTGVFEHKFENMCLGSGLVLTRHVTTLVCTANVLRDQSPEGSGKFPNYGAMDRRAASIGALWQAAVASVPLVTRIDTTVAEDKSLELVAVLEQAEFKKQRKKRNHDGITPSK